MELKLYEIAPELRALMEAEDFESERFDQLTMAFEQKALGVSYFIKELKAFSAMAKDEAKRVTALAKAAESRADRLTAYIKNCMEASEIYELEADTVKFKIKKNPPAVVIDNEEIVPPEYRIVEVVKKIDKKAISADLKAGKEVQGCRLVQGDRLDIK